MTTAELVIRRLCDPMPNPRLIGTWEYSVRTADNIRLYSKGQYSWISLSDEVRMLAESLPDGWTLDVLSGIDGRWYEWPITRKGQ